jgi:outer membrane biosynthesis protein TonB
VVAERDLTSRVDLIAGLDALQAVGLDAQVVLLDDVTAARLTAAEPEPEREPEPEPEPEPDPEPEPEPEPDPEPEPGPGPEASAPVLPEPAPTAPEPVDPEPEPEPDPAPVRRDPDPGLRFDLGPTTRLQPVDLTDPWGPDDDPLRTTAQLAVLLDHLEAREDS